MQVDSGSRGSQTGTRASQRGAGTSATNSAAVSTESPLDKPVQFVKGVGPHRARILANLSIATVGDLIEHFPFRFDHQQPPQAIDTLRLDEPATVIGAVEQVKGGRGRQGALHIRVCDGTGTMRVTWFNASFMRDRLERGQILRLFGKVDEYEGLAQMVNPQVEWLDPDDDPNEWQYDKLVPVYPATGQMSSGQIARIIETALVEALPAVVEPLPDSLRGKHEFPLRREAIRRMHQPVEEGQRQAARRRLAYEELFMMQLAIALQRRWSEVRAKAPAMPSSDRIDARIRRRFPFALTPAQNKVISQITADLAGTKPMTRLLQGDVGSGKTVVALYAALVAVTNRKQCAILAPTEVLAVQHYAGIDRYLVGSRVRICLLTGKTDRRERGSSLTAIAEGQMDLIVGTQALLETKVQFADLGLVIVDEQHKFGVSQRARMRGKNTARGQTPVPHYLVMTATPIPRTLSMTVFGDLDVSIIDRLPPGRQPIQTHLVSPSEEGCAWLEVRRRIAAGEQAYIVYPLVEESDKLELKAATTEVDRVRQEALPGARVGLVHGRMNGSEKRAVMNAFKSGELDALVSTTVIEVGVDVPNATVMVIEHAERYGLAALHQLRGRVGRGSKESLCLLMSDSRSHTGRDRLNVLCETTDGFRIAEEDLRMRGPGELLGTRQHGWPEFRVADLIKDTELLMQARDDAADLVRRDPKLAEPSHAMLKSELRRRFREKVALIDVG